MKNYEQIVDILAGADIRSRQIGSDRDLLWVQWNTSWVDVWVQVSINDMQDWSSEEIVLYVIIRLQAYLEDAIKKLEEMI